MVLVFALAFFAGAMSSMAQGTNGIQKGAANVLIAQESPGGMSNAPGGGSYLPTLSGNRSSEFTASSQSDAQAICDQVAAKNNKSSCTAQKGTGMDMWYCDCK